MRVLTVLLLLTASCFAKPKYDHIGKMIYHAAELKYLLEGRTDLYYDDNFYGDRYICTPGDEHHAPDCRKDVDWYATVKPSWTEIVLDDGTKVNISLPPPLLNAGPNSDLNSMAEAWEKRGLGLNPLYPDPKPHIKEGDVSTFVFRVRKGRIEVDPLYKDFGGHLPADAEVVTGKESR
jgi:hypothetical protein